MRKSKKKLCVGITTGKIVQVKEKGLNYPTLMTVSYFVNGTEYQITESVKLKSEIIKLGFLPIGQRKYPVIKARTGTGVAVGNEVNVSYNPDMPETAYITDNEGKMNV